MTPESSDSWSRCRPKDLNPSRSTQPPDSSSWDLGSRSHDLITQTVNAGLSGLQGLAGFPATIGGACIMNAGGKFGTISDHLIEVHAMDRAGRMHGLKKSDIDFSYRHSGLNHLLICSAIFELQHADPQTLKAELVECMNYKKDSQPMNEKSAGCAFKNPTLQYTIEGIGEAGTRVSAGMLIDRAGCKGMTHHGASVSNLHANFITTTRRRQSPRCH